jgi:hypothetical protein
VNGTPTAPAQEPRHRRAFVSYTPYRFVPSSFFLTTECTTSTCADDTHARCADTSETHYSRVLDAGKAKGKGRDAQVSDGTRAFFFLSLRRRSRRIQKLRPTLSIPPASTGMPCAAACGTHHVDGAALVLSRSERTVSSNAALDFGSIEKSKSMQGAPFAPPHVW